VTFSLALLTTEFSSKGIWYLVAAGTVFLYRWRPSPEERPRPEPVVSGEKQEALR
jgi:hypothetical protein